MPWLLRQQSYRVCSLHMASDTTTELLLVKFPSSPLGADYHTGPGAHLKLKTRVQQAFYLGSIQPHCRGEKRVQALTCMDTKILPSLSLPRLPFGISSFLLTRLGTVIINFFLPYQVSYILTLPSGLARCKQEVRLVCDRPQPAGARRSP